MVLDDAVNPWPAPIDAGSPFALRARPALRPGELGFRLTLLPGSHTLAKASMTDEEAARIRAVVNRAVRAACPGWLSTDLEDIAQTATVKILARFAGEGEDRAELAASYLWRTAHSVVVDCMRSRARRPSTSLETETGSIDPPHPAPGPDALLLGAEVRKAILQCLAALVAPRRRATSLHLLGHQVSEIAQLCSWPVKRADNLVYRGLADLRGCLRSKGYGDEH
ncbi:MAG TPA: RNA polymerase sigma factor [Thermoanaerobaculia bacterium]|nr:RNA polymerase sigma factor [Thermoanaerobaculia bacterium]